MIIFKIVLLQLFWFLIVLFGHKFNPLFSILAALLILVFNFLVSKVNISIYRYLFIAAAFTLFGFLHDSILIWSEIVIKDSYSYSFLSLWIVFIAYYDDVFIKFKNAPILAISLIGAFGGALAYWSAYKLEALSLFPERNIFYVLLPGAMWAVFFPTSMWLYYKDKYWESILDKSILFSFDNSGFYRHQKKFIDDFSFKKIHTTTSLVTGGTSGIGEEVAAALSKMGGKVIVTGRNESKGRSFEANHLNSTFISLDMGDWDNIRSYCKSCEVFDYIVLNAGSMPEKLTVNKAQVESQCASQLIGHYLLIKELKENGKLKTGARIIWVSSGGMYLKKLDLNTLFRNTNYEKVSTYANVKRAQVTLVQELSLLPEWREFLLLSMHPGWVGTQGLKEALPKFYGIMENRLRTPKEGADTILWLLLTQAPLDSGGLYFDRKKVSPYISQKYNPSKRQRALLLEMIKQLS